MRPPPAFSISLQLCTNSNVATLQSRRAIHYRHRTATYSLYNHHRTPIQSRRPAYAPRIEPRYASSAATALKSRRTPLNAAPAKSNVPAKSPASNVPVPQVRERLNPPPETNAPKLDVPSRARGQGYFKYLWQCGRLYIQFYKQGIKNVRATAKLAKSLREKAAKAPAGERDTVLSRAEWQIVRRSRRDMMRLPAFGVLVLMMGEWLPLLALYITPLIPEPCRIPAQIRRKLEKQETRRKERERRLAIDAARLVARDRKPGMTNLGIVRPEAVRLEEVDHMDLYTLLNLSTKLDCHSWIWDRLFLTPPKPLLRMDVRRKLGYLRRDDMLIERDGGWQALEGKEVERACVERGIAVLGRKEADLRRELAAWFKK